MQNSKDSASTFDQVNSVNMNKTFNDVIRVVHKVIIDNFSHYIEDDFWNDTLFVSKLYKGKQFNSCIHLNTTKNAQMHKFEIFVNFKLHEKINAQVEYKLSMLDGEGKYQYVKVDCNEVEEVGMYGWNYERNLKYLTNDEKLMKNGEVTVRCEIIMTPKNNLRSNKNILKIDYIDDDQNGNIYVFTDILNAKPKVVNFLTHKWTIDNFGYFYRDEWKSDEIYSDNFYSNSNQEHKFHLRLYPNGVRDERKNNLSVYLCYSSHENVDVNVRFKISIIDEAGKKFNTKIFEYTFNQKLNNFGDEEYISVSQLLDHSNELLSDDTLTLLCEVEVMEDRNSQIEDNKPVSTAVSESYYNAKSRVIDSLSHKWTIENFGYFHRDEWKYERIHSGCFYSNSNKGHQFHLCLYPNGKRNIFKNNLSIYLYHSSFDNVDVIVRCKLSIINENNDKLNTEIFNNTFNRKHNAHGFNEYICVSQLLDNSNGFLHDGQLSLYCEIQILENEIQNSLFASMKSAHQSIHELNQSFDSVHLSKCAHKWTIHNFACALAEESSVDQLVSCRFPTHLKSNEFSFFLSIFPKKYYEEGHKYFPICINVQLFKKMQLTFQYRISHIDANGSNRKLFDGQRSVEDPTCISIYFSDIHKYVFDYVLMLYCEIEVIKNWSNTDLLENKVDEYFCNLAKLKPNGNEVTETVSNVKAKKIQMEYTWEIEICGGTSVTDPSSLFNTQPTSSYIESPPFYPPNHSTTNQHRFYLQMYPNGMNEEYKDYVSMFFGVDTFEKRQMMCTGKISLIDYSGFRLKTNNINTYQQNGNNIFRFGWNQFISHSDLFNPAYELITDDKLRVHCEIEFIDEKDIEKQNKITEIGEITENLDSSTIPTQTITQVIVHTHHWTIKNFDQYIQSIQDNSSYLESIKISPASDDHLQLIARLYTNKRMDLPSIYFDLICSQKQIPALVHISVLDENYSKCYSGNWQYRLNMQCLGIHLKLNFINQLKLSIQFSIYTNYSSPAEISHLDQFSVDQFTSSWQVKRQCDVQTHSSAATYIPVESCNFEWSIQDFSSQQKNVQSSTFSLEQLELFFQMFTQQQQDKVTIYLCLKKSVEKETKLCLKMSILNKDGHKISTKDVVVKLTDVELEYKCTDFDINTDLIQEDDKLKMFCELHLVGEPSCSAAIVPSIPKVLPQLNALLKNRQASDVVLNFVNGNQLHAHRSILSAQSAVFFGMFQHDTIEAQLGQVDITDVDIKVFEIMLQYIYTGLVELDPAWTLDLMIAADKYDLIELKEQCENWLCTNLSIETVTECLVWSDQIGTTKLKSESIQFFHRNSFAISQTNTIEDIIQKRPQLMKELYLESTRYSKSNVVSNLIEEEEEEDISVL